MNSTSVSKTWLCLVLASLRSLAGCAEGEPIAADYKAVGKSGHAGNGSSVSLAAGGSSMQSTTDIPSETAGSGGAGGSTPESDSGSSGSMTADSGTAGGGNPYDGPLSTGLKVEYVAQNGAGLSFSVRITNNGSDMPPLSSLKIRYFFTNETSVDASSITFDDAAWHSGNNMMPYYVGKADLSPQVTVTKVTPTKTGADTYLELSSGKSDIALSPKDTLEFHPRSTANGGDQTDDYSYQAGAALADNPHIVVLQAGAVIAGMAP